MTDDQRNLTALRLVEIEENADRIRAALSKLDALDPDVKAAGEALGYFIYKARKEVGRVSSYATGYDDALQWVIDNLGALDDADRERIEEMRHA